MQQTPPIYVPDLGSSTLRGRGLETAVVTKAIANAIYINQLPLLSLCFLPGIHQTNQVLFADFKARPYLFTQQDLESNRLNDPTPVPDSRYCAKLSQRSRNSPRNGLGCPIQVRRFFRVAVLLAFASSHVVPDQGPGQP